MSGQSPALKDADAQTFSCLVCRQRKVKCDRQTPCSNCIKAGRRCRFVAPTRGKRKRTKTPKEGLHARLRRYEELLRSYGARVDAPELEAGEDYSDLETEDTGLGEVGPEIDQADDGLESTQDAPRAAIDPPGLKVGTPGLVTTEGVSRYVDSSLWAKTRLQYHQPLVDGLSGSTDSHSPASGGGRVDDIAEQNDLLLQTSSSTMRQNLSASHPPLHISAKLWDVYIDRVDPLMKVLHLPTFLPLLSGVTRNPRRVSKQAEALIFSFYLAATTSLRNEECLDTLGTEKAVLQRRYRLAARQALINAEWLTSTSTTTLQALMMYMMGGRGTYHSDTMYILSGVAVRLARKMGLHRDGASLGLSPFDAEMRRRLWWAIVQADFRLSDVISARPSLDIFACDAKVPLSIADEDLLPEMLQLPPERRGITSVSMCRFRCEILDFMQRISPRGTSDVRWDSLSDTEMSLAEKDELILRAEDHFEGTYLRYCDPSEPLHTLLSIMIRSSLCRMRLHAHSPRRFTDKNMPLPESERDVVFANASKLLGYAALMSGYESLQKYSWHMSSSFLWNATLYVLIEARHRRIGPDIDKFWKTLGTVLGNYRMVFESSSGPLMTVLRKWTVEVWDEYVVAMKSAGHLEPAAPGYIGAMRLRLDPSSKRSEVVVASRPGSAQEAAGQALASSTIEGGLMPDAEIIESSHGGAADLEAEDWSEFLSNMPSFEMNENEWWSQWEQLLAAEAGD